MKEFGLTATALGVLSSMYFYPYAAMQIPSGILADYVGPRLSVAVFFLIAAVGTILFGLAHTFGMIMVGRFMMGMGVAVVAIPAMRIMANWFRPDEFSTLVGIMLTLGNVGAIFATAPLAFVVNLMGWRASFYWVGAGLAVIAVLNYVIVRNKPKDMGLPTISEIDGIDYYQTAKDEKDPTFLENCRKLFRMKNYWLMAVYAFMIYGTVMGFQGLWFVPYAQNVYGLPKQTAANMLMMWPVGMAIGSFVMGIVSDRVFKSNRKTSFYGIIIYIICWLPVVLATGHISPGAFYPLIFIMGFFCAAYIPNYSHISEGQHHSFIATANGMLNIWYFVGGAFFQYIMGRVLDAYGKVDGKFPAEAYQMAFAICIIGLVIGAIVMYFTDDNKVIVKKARA
jgi:sugar phosphate permease